MPITPEQAQAELARRRAASAAPATVSSTITPEMARAELTRRKTTAPVAPVNDPTAGASLPVVGLAAVPAQLTQKTITTLGAAKTNAKAQEGIDNMRKIAQQFFDMSVKETDPIKKRELLDEGTKVSESIRKSVGVVGKNIESELESERVLGTPALSNEPGRAFQQVVGRGISAASAVTPALGPAGSGAMLGLGESIERDSGVGESLLRTGGYALGGKVAGEVFGAASRTGLGQKVLGSKPAKFVGDVLERASVQPAKGTGIYGDTGRVLDIAARKFGETADTLVSPSAYLKGAQNVGLVKTPEQNIQRVIDARAKELEAIDKNYSSMRKASGFSKDEGVASRRRVAATDVLVDSVDENGLIRTTGKGGPIDQYRAQTLDGAEGVVRKNLVRNGEKVNLKKVAAGLREAVDSSGLEGDDLISAINKIKREIAGYSLKADANGNILLEVIHDAKISTTKGIDYNTPAEIKTYRKAIARGLKKIVEDYSTLFEVKPVNAELQKYLDDIDFLERLDGKRVKGGKLGKYFAQISGNIVGGIAGGAIGGMPGSAVGTIVGGELAGRIKGSALSRTLGGRTGYVAPKSKILEEAIELSKSPRAALPPYSNNLGSRNAQYNTAAIPNRIPIEETIPQKPKPVVLPKNKESDPTTKYISHYDDEIDSLIQGKIKLRVNDGGVRTEYKDMLSRDNYMRVFRKDSKYKTTDEFAEDLGMTENELMDEMQKRIFDSTYNRERVLDLNRYMRGDIPKAKLPKAK